MIERILTTISTVVPLLTSLQSNCLIGRAQKGLLRYETITVTRLATLLDARFKKEGFYSPHNATEAAKLLENELAVCYMISKDKNQQQEQLPTPAPKSQSLLFGFLEDKNRCIIRTNKTESFKDLRHFYEEGIIDQKADVLEYWKVK